MLPSFGATARKKQADFRSSSDTISAAGRAPTDSKGKLNDHLLALGSEYENLYPSIRGADGAVKFFRDRKIQWWRNARSGDAKGKEGPTRNMASSQIACVNFLLPLVEIEGALPAFIQAIDGDATKIVPINHEGNTSCVEFEWIGVNGPLEKDAPRVRGANTTSVDAFVVAEATYGKTAYLLEWKYVEEYPTRNNYLGNGSPGETRLRRYCKLYAESSSFNGVVPIEELLYEPLYQLMRQRLLADRMVRCNELGVSKAKVIAVVPEENTAYRNRLTSPELAKRFPDWKTVSDLFRATLKDPDDAYSIICPSVLVNAIESACGDSVAKWVSYQRERYGWHAN